MRRRTLVILLLCAGAARARAQDSASGARAIDRRAPFNAWASLTLGPGHASNRDPTRIGVQIAGFVSRGPWLAAVRRGGASGFDSGGAYDDALLVGRRWRKDPKMLYVAVGPAKVYDESTGRGTLGVGFAAGPAANVRVLGLGITAFGATTGHLSFIAIGITADAGWIR